MAAILKRFRWRLSTIRIPKDIKRMLGLTVNNLIPAFGYGWTGFFFKSVPLGNAPCSGCGQTTTGVWGVTAAGQQQPSEMPWHW